MNAITAIDLTVGTDWDSIYTEVNAWRGACIHHFSMTEMAVTETLLVLDAVKREGKAVRLRHLIGQRFEDLADAIATKGVFANEGKQMSRCPFYIFRKWTVESERFWMERTYHEFPPF